MSEVVVVIGPGSIGQAIARRVSAGKHVEIDLGRHHFRATAHTLDERQAVDILASYERRNRLAAPLIRRVLSSLLEWPYDGSDGARHRLVQELPVMAFTPPARADPRWPRVRRRHPSVQPSRWNRCK